MNESKKNVIVNGKVLLPLKIGQRAVIFKSNGGSTRTSIVEAINQVADSFIMFETKNSVYYVKQSKTTSPIALVETAA